MTTLLRERRTTETMLLAVIAIAAMSVLRFPSESRFLFLSEMFLITSFFCIGLAKRLSVRTLILILPAVPITCAVFARYVGSSTAYEMTALTTLGTVALAMAGGSNRTRAMSLVASGFLTLFSVAISDDMSAVWIAITWMSICVWHLVANHWERLDVCAVEQVHRSAGVRPMSVVAAVAICVIGGLVVRDRFGPPHRFESGFMPTSGGSQWSDPAARSGVGSGDQAIAAKDHAESFGAVQSDLFLESTQSTLFDMFSDALGEPKKRKQVFEKRQGMNSDKVLESHERSAKSEKGGSSFSTDRKPVQKHMHLGDAIENSVVQWSGPSGIRLAMNRYDTFDGADWTNQAKHKNRRLRRHEINGAVWFSEPSVKVLDKASTNVNLLKIMRLESTHVPVPMLTTALHIKDIDRGDFYAIDDDGSFYMPDRKNIPQFTVINVASQSIMEDEIWKDLKSYGDPASDQSTSDLASQSQSLTKLAKQWTAGQDHPYEKLQSIVAHLRRDYAHDRTVTPSGDEPLETFLRSRRGGDHLFATAAALLAREVGLRSRLVTGFYVRPSAIDLAAGHTNVLPDDVHVWVEVQLADGRWIEIEPTPGYRLPVYTPSKWLVAKQFAAAKWQHAIGMMLIAGLMFWTRLFWVELGLGILFRVGSILWPRGRTALAMRVLQTRAKWAGCPKPAGRPQRDWLLSLTTANDSLCELAKRFCDAADRSAFGVATDTVQQSLFDKELLMQLNIRTLRQLHQEAIG